MKYIGTGILPLEPSRTGCPRRCSGEAECWSAEQTHLEEPREATIRATAISLWWDSPSEWYHPVSCHATTSSAGVFIIFFQFFAIGSIIKVIEHFSSESVHLFPATSVGLRFSPPVSISLVIWLHIFWLANYSFISCFKRVVKHFRRLKKKKKVLSLVSFLLLMLSTDTRPLFPYLHISD